MNHLSNIVARMAACRARVSLSDAGGNGYALSGVKLVGAESLLALARIRPLRVDAPLLTVAAVAGGALVNVDAGRAVAREGEPGLAPALVAAL